MLGTFEQIRIYFENKEILDDWIDKITKIIKLQKQIEEDEIYKFHPFNSVSYQKLLDLLKVMEAFDSLSKALANVQGDFNKHVAFFRDKIISNKVILSEDPQTLTSTQKVIKEFCKVLDNFVSDSTIQNYAAEFFAKHLRNIIKPFEVENKKKNDFYLNFQNMLNLRHYKYVFFMELALDKS